MRLRVLLTLAVSLVAVNLQAQAPSITVRQIDCLPEERNGVIDATVEPEVGGATVRLFFRWDDHGAMYFVDMFAAGGGNYWGIPARPEARNEMVEYYVSVMDAYGRTLAKSESLFAPVRDDCRVELTPKQVGVANNLVVGETVPAQEGKKVLGFLCDGVVTRINHEGIMRPDEICRGCVIPWWMKEEYVASLGAVGAATAIILEDPGPEPSPSRP